MIRIDDFKYLKAMGCGGVAMIKKKKRTKQ
jgi:hypothetical protein